MIEFKILALLSPNGFDDRFWKHCKSEKTYKAAYEKTENEFTEHYGKRKYADYNSFRNCRDKRISKKANRLHK